LREAEVRAEFEDAAQRHALGLRQVALEDRNLEVARLQAEAARERYRVGSASPLVFRDAQRKLLDAQSRLISARRDAKAAELALKRLAGVLVREARVE
jgi:outer membrane protein TolC